MHRCFNFNFVTGALQITNDDDDDNNDKYCTNTQILGK